MIRLVVGLGNPGNQYRLTRHNIGVRFIDRLAESFSPRCSFRPWKSLLDVGQVSTAKSERVFLAKSLSYMNESGKGISFFSQFHRFPPASILICYDDLDLPLGQIRIRTKGSSGGHKGVESILTTLRSEEIPRLRLGIGSPNCRDAVAFVLNPFHSSEEKIVSKMLNLALEAVGCIFNDGLEKAMNEYNARLSIS
ncbi:MAG: aminoacyl-tRNA hydrolase [Elusimicrobia bacterium]|nr:aminoacyl-tRNA hydrolase [Elusimicrobiota bacterium]